VAEATWHPQGTDTRSRRLCVQGNIADMAGSLAADARANTPVLSGRLAAGWRTEPGREPGTTVVVNDTPYLRFVEYGTRHRPASAMMGRALASARSATR
jgi:hypothetical protein